MSDNNIYDNWSEQPINCRNCGETIGYILTFMKIVPKKSRIICVLCKNIELEVLV